MGVKFCMSQLIILSLILGLFASSKSTENDFTEYTHPKYGAKWRASHSNKRFRTANEVDGLLGARREGAEERARRPTIHHPLSANNELPISFNAIDKWYWCKSITQIRDQSKCGSCWAVAAVEAMTDRVCIHSNGKYRKRLSETDLLACCKTCGDGCDGGWPARAWDFWKSDGVVTGGSREAQEGCKSYPFPRCTHYGEGKYKKCPTKRYPTPICINLCDSDVIDFEKDKTRANSSYNVPANEKQIMMEIMTNGPVEAGFDVYEDFPTYTSGIYFHAWGELKSGHAVKIVGWGEEDGVPYWLIANSWNEGWGENGFVRFLRGMDECGIESEITAGMTDLDAL
ncbi:cathepsin B [Paragonimus westermani]|uniref:Cathepsin B-like cysteine proteinase n=2 Tax=Paragonimus westermani TaxID=34504 RepID=A0A5J4NED8_9TREM|nr:cathepsin B [Paragonimus westermani]